MCGERAAEVTVIDGEEAERLVTLKSSKWYEANEPWKEHGAISTHSLPDGVLLFFTPMSLVYYVHIWYDGVPDCASRVGFTR